MGLNILSRIRFMSRSCDQAVVRQPLVVQQRRRANSDNLYAPRHACQTTGKSVGYPYP